jgi:hypothetical protein
MLQRKLQHLALTVAVSAMGLTLAGTKPVLAEFEIQEAGIEKGEVELEYRGAYHWGLPKTGGGVAAGNADEEEEGEVEEEEEEVPLRQSHDFEMQMGITDWWMISTTLGTVVPEGGSWLAESVELETQFQLIKRRGNGIALSFATGYGWATRPDTANEVEFGPIMEFAAGKFLLTTNTFFSRQMGEFAETRRRRLRIRLARRIRLRQALGRRGRDVRARSRIYPIPSPSTIRSTASARPCFGSLVVVRRTRRPATSARAMTTMPKAMPQSPPGRNSR